MKAYKDKQFLVFEFTDGKTVKYNLATKETIGKLGKPVKNINSQLSGYDLITVIESFNDINYKNYLYFLNKNFINKTVKGTIGCKITNVGSFLSRINDYSYFEQYFSAGVRKISPKFVYDINELPKGYVNFCKKNSIVIDDFSLIAYQNFSAKLNAINEEHFNSLSMFDILQFVVPQYYSSYRIEYYKGRQRNKIEMCGERAGAQGGCDYCSFLALTETYHYNWLRLLHYIDDLITYEGLTSWKNILKELEDYNKMLSSISTHKYEKYPKYFLSMHSIVCRNYNRLNKTFSVTDFSQRVNKKMEYTYKNYVFIYPGTPDDIKDEAVQQTNCVASYIDAVLAGTCDIIFLRDKNTPQKSLVTIEVRNNRVVQALRAFNKPISNSEQVAISHYNAYLAKIAKGKINSKEAKQALKEINKVTNKLSKKEKEKIAV